MRFLSRVSGVARCGIGPRGHHGGATEYSLSMTTTIKVSDELRDRLKQQAAVDGLTLGAHLARLADTEDRRRRLLALKVAVESSRTVESDSHAAETDDWERTELTDAS